MRIQKRLIGSYKVRENHGFTLLEMVISVFIMSVMMAVVMPHLLSAGQQAQKSACEQNQRTIREALIEYKLVYHSYPAGDTVHQLQELKDKMLLSSLPVDPDGGQYQIDTTTHPNEVVVTCTVHGELGQ